MKDLDSLELRRRLSNLGRRRPHISIQSAHKELQSIGLPEGRWIRTPSGEAFQMEQTYHFHDPHGHYPISYLLSFSSQLLAEVARKPELGNVPLEQLVFLDTETTGLAGGAGTLVFLVGLGRFFNDHFLLRQYFLHDPAKEAAMFHALLAELEQAAGFVTYNGQAFDLPMLENRYIMSFRKRLALLDYPNIDLLHIARRLWRSSLPDCTLSTIEGHILGVQRTEQDVPSSWIPDMYLDYLRTGNTAEINRIIYHNAIDVLSLVTLTGQILRRHYPEDMGNLSSAEALSVARWHQDLGRDSPAETAFKKAILTEDKGLRIEALRRYTEYLRRSGSKAQAVERWETWHELAPSDPRPCIELAKYYEWDLAEVERAIHWAQEALQCLTHWPADWRRQKVWEEVEHRLQRLAKKREAVRSRESTCPQAS
jgi:uncharacterized protein YprB with RNaseH-like and TPR domain